MSEITQNNKWSPSDWCLVILAITIPMTLLGLLVVRLLSAQPIPPESAALMADLLKVLCGGILGVLGAKSNKV